MANREQKSNREKKKPKKDKAKPAPQPSSFVTGAGSFKSGKK